MSPTPTTGKTFRFPIRVYYEDTDAAGVVYYANYLKFMERARTEWLAALGFELAELERAHGVAVRRRIAMEIEYRLPARLGDRLDATLELVELGRARMVALQQVRRGASLLTAGSRDARLHRSRATLAPGTDPGTAPRPTGETLLNVATDLSFLTLIAQASLVVQAVLLLLACLVAVVVVADLPQDVPAEAHGRGTPTPSRTNSGKAAT